MTLFFSRKELLVTMDMNRQAAVRDILSANGINYTVKVTNRQSASAFSSSRQNAGNFGTDPAYAYEYKIYVHTKDYDKALRLII